MRTIITLLLLLCLGASVPPPLVSSKIAPSGSTPASASDTFTRADQDPLAGNWTTDGTLNTLKLSGNSVTYHSTTMPCEAHWNAVTFNANQSSQVDTTVTTGGPAVRCSTDGSKNFYGCYSDGSSVRIFKVTGGSVSQVASTSGNGGNPCTLKITASGSGTTVLTVYTNGLQALQYSDSSSPFTSGQPGMWFQDFNSGNLDNWSAADL